MDTTLYSKNFNAFVRNVVLDTLQIFTATFLQNYYSFVDVQKVV